MWNKICPHSRSEYFTAEQFHFAQQNFTCPMGKFHWKNDMLKSQRKACVVKYPLTRMWNYGKSHSEILRKTQCEIKFAHIREANTSLRSNFTLRSKISLARKGKFHWKNPIAKAIGFFLVGEDGFEPSKRNAADLQSVPFGHSGTPPYKVVEMFESIS